MDKQEEMPEMQQFLSLANLLDNVLHVFDLLPNNQKDELIQKYKGGAQDFPDV